MEKMRKIDSECRTLKDQWNFQYLLTETSKKELCLIRNETIAVFREYNISRHHKKEHFQNYAKYTQSLQSTDCLQKFSNLVLRKSI